MKIGILTFHRAINYGAFMQAFALSNMLKERFPDDSIEIIDYNHRNREIFIRKCPLIFLYRRSIQEGFQKFRQTQVFLKALDQLPLSKKYLGTDLEQMKKILQENYDTVIVGSDAVFNWNDLGLPNLYFLGGVNCANKLSYAASAHLQKYNEISEENKKYLKDALCSFQYLGVRDDSTANFVSNILGADTAVHNCDPSVFLPMDFSEMDLQKKLRKHNFDFQKKTVFVMLMHPEYAKFARKYFGDDVQIVALMDGNKDADIYLYDLNPLEWAHVFKYGACLVTDYFHGTLFCLKNGTPVLSIDASSYSGGVYESKAQDLLQKRLNLPYVYVNASELKGETGYQEFERHMSLMLQQFHREDVEKALAREAQSCKSFCTALQNLHR